MLTDEEKVELVFNFLDSSSDDDDDYLYDFFISETSNAVPRIQGYIMNVVHRYNEKSFQEFFRLSRDTCNELIECFKRSNFYPNKNGQGRPGQTAEAHILLFLRFAGEKIPIRNVAELFDVSPSTAYVMIQRVIKFLNDLAPSVIQFPNTAEERQAKADEFLEIANIDGIVGAIDGSYITIRTPERKISSTYANRHEEPSLTLQAICDAHCKFIDCFTGLSGRMHDARIYKLSFVKNKIQNMGREFHVIGDGAYPLSVNLLTPYRDYGNLTEEQINYNEQFSRCRVKIENAFGLLKGRFRQLMHLEMTNVKNMSLFIISCCVLHNLCIERGDINEEYKSYAELYSVNTPDFEQDDCREKHLGSLKRDEIATLLRV